MLKEITPLYEQLMGVHGEQDIFHREHVRPDMVVQTRGTVFGLRARTSGVAVVLRMTTSLADDSARILNEQYSTIYFPGQQLDLSRGNDPPDHRLPETDRPPSIEVEFAIDPDQPVRYAAASKDTGQYHVCLGAPGIARSDRRRFAASILDSILGGSASSRLFQEIREKRGLAYSVYSFASQYTDTGLVGIYVGTREENLATCLEIAGSELADIAAGKLRKDEISRAKENLKGRIMLSMESTSNRMSRLGKSLITDTELLSFERIIAEIEAVEPDEVAELAGLLFAAEKLSVSGIGPKEAVFRTAAGRINPAATARAA
jgi:hypothetical protein